MNRIRRLSSRIACAIAIGILASEAMLANVPVVRAASPEPSSQVEVAPSLGPEVTLDPSPDFGSPIPTLDPRPSPVPDATATPTSVSTLPADAGIGDGDVESLRTESSQTFANADGTRTTQFFAAPVFYRPSKETAYAPIEVGFTGDTKANDDVSARSDKSPASVAVGPLDSTGGFLATAKGDSTISLALPDATRTDAPSTAPTLDGPAADYRDVLPGVDLRVLAQADGARSFVIWHSEPQDPTISFEVDAPGLTVRLEPDGTISFRDATGERVAWMPRPYATDSTPDAALGSGTYTDKVSYSLATDGTRLTLSVDPDWLKTAVYPVYVDPTVTWDNQGDLSYGDAHIASGYSTTNYSNYQRPDSPYYHELWLGTDPAGTSGTSYDYLRWNTASLAGTIIDAASVEIYPYHQYYNAPTSTTTWLRQVTGINGQASWAETYPTWTNQYSHTGGTVATAACVEGTTCSFDVKPIVAAWAGGTANYGIKLDENSNGSTYWKRLIAAEQGGGNVPSLTVTWHTMTATLATPGFTGGIGWTYANGDGLPQTKYRVDIATTAAFSAVLLTSGDVTSAVPSWRISAGLTDLSTYWYRVKVYDGIGWSAWSAPTSFHL